MPELLVDPRPSRRRRAETIDWPIIPPTLLSLHRTSRLDEQSRQIVCALDGVKVTELLFGQKHTCEILPGPHTLRVHNTLMWRTIPFDAAPGGHVHFTVSNRSGRGYYALLFVIGVAPLYLAVEPGVPR